MNRQATPLSSVTYASIIRNGLLSVAGWEWNLGYHYYANQYLGKIEVIVKPRDQCLDYYQNLDINQDCAESVLRNSSISEVNKKFESFKLKILFI